MAHTDRAAPQRLELFLLGKPRICLNGQPLREQPPVKGQALLFYLAATRKTLTREALAGLFWGEMGEEPSRANLRLTLSRLRKLLGPCLTADRREVRCDFDRPLWVDIHEFEQATAIRQAAGPALAAALNLYRGEFLHDFSVGDAPEFEMWVLGARERLHRLALNALHALLQSELAAGDYPGAINTSRRMLDLQPWHEEAHRRLMWLLGMSGQRGAALAQYELCCRILDQELGVPPEDATTALYEKIKRGNIRPDTQPDTEPASSSPAEVVSWAAARPAAVEGEDLSAAPPTQRFVGRARELQILHSALRESATGAGQQLFVVGGAGRGKSSLLREFVRHTQDELPELLIARGRCSAREGIGDPYLPFREILQQLTGDVRSTGGAVLERSQARSLAYAVPITLPLLVEAAPDLIGNVIPARPLLARAQTASTPDTPWLRRLSSLAASQQPTQMEQPRLFAQVTAFLVSLAARRPLLLVLDDLQWADASSVALLFHLSQFLAGNRILLVGAYRPDEVAERSGAVHPLARVLGELKRQLGHIWIDLAQQSSVEARAFVDAYLDTEPNLLDDDFRSRLLRHTGGHALFTAEVLRELQIRGELAQDSTGNWTVARSIDWNTLPAKVEGVIEQRIQALDKELRTWLTIAAVEGESFTAEVIARILGVEARVAVRRLSQELGQEHRLLQAQSLEHSGEQRLSGFRFRHQLFQQYLYQSLNAAERAYYHEDVGSALEALYAQRATEIAGSLTEHFQAAGNSQKAVRYLALAAQQAHVKAANSEAAEYARAGLALLEAIPPGVDRMKLELLLQIVRGRSAMFIDGYAAAEAEAGFLRARQLCEQMGRIPQIFPVMYGLWALCMMRGELETARRQALQHIALAAEVGNVRAEMLGHGMVGLPLCWLGALPEAREHLERLFVWYQPEYDAENIAVIGQAALLARLAGLPMLLAMLGAADQARVACGRIVQMSEALADPISRGFALSFAGITFQLLGDVENTERYADATIAHCEKQSIPLSLAYGYVLRGWVLSRRGDGQGTLLMRRQIDRLRARRELSGTTWLISLLVGGLMHKGQREAALQAADEGLALAEDIGDLANRVFLLQQKGAILMATAAGALAADAAQRQDAADHLLAAIQLGQQTGNRLGALRAAISLCELWDQQGQRAQAREILQAVYAACGEGLDTAPLRAAGELLAAR